MLIFDLFAYFSFYIPLFADGATLTTVHDIAHSVLPAGSGPMPDNLDLSFRLYDEDVALNLTRNDNVDPNAPVIIGRGGQFIEYTNPQRHDVSQCL